jgi:Xaa-Pro aminopeptidase
VAAALAGPAARRGRLAALLAAEQVDAVLVTSLVNIRYLTGFTGSNAALLVPAAAAGDPVSAVLCTDFRYAEQSRLETPDVEVLIARPCALALARRAASGGRLRLGFEAHHLTVLEHDDIAAAVAAEPAAELVRVGQPVEDLRRVKDPGELDLLREACAIGDRALADLLPALRAGLTEREVARALDDRMRDHGAQAPGFDTIVAAGPNGAVPHHSPGERRLAAGDLLTLDFGARYGGYHADMTRTVAVGAPAGWQRDLYALVRDAQRAGRHALVPGARLADVDGAARSVIAAAGHGTEFGHGLGHGVGLEIHEAPMIGADSTGTLEAGSPVTVEPGVYLPGRGGVRIEDTLVVRDGRPELLTTSSKELLVLG